ncbi:MAG: hypothetical protein NTV79_10290 [Candidatus Aureabacteria bacterium]|nr:hypothetical protein [Candidatus Auribacterota bacterium]
MNTFSKKQFETRDLVSLPPRRRTLLRLLLLALAALLLAAGVYLQEHKKTAENASYLCLDCIGIGK